MPRFRLFGRTADGPPPYPAPPRGSVRPTPPGTGGWPPPVEDAQTDPVGFPAIRPAAYPASAYAPPGAVELAPVPPVPVPPVPVPPAPARAAVPPAPAPLPAARPIAHAPAPVSVRRGAGSPDPAEASALAGAFAADYLSWDEDDPDRRSRVIADYLAVPGGEPLGWSGRGRQRTDFVLPGLVRPDGEGRVLVDVRVRVTPYRPVGDHGRDAGADAPPEVAGVPAAAPAPTARGWRSLASCWVRISVPVVFEGGRLVVDAADETLGGESVNVAPAPVAVDDHSLADDDAPPAAPAGPPPIVPVSGGAW